MYFMKGDRKREWGKARKDQMKLIGIKFISMNSLLTYVYICL